MPPPKNDNKQSGAISYSAPEADRSLAERSDSDQHALHSRIAERAHQKFVARGGEHGHDQEDWMSAEEELASEVHEPQEDSFREDPRLPRTHDGAQAR